MLDDYLSPTGQHYVHTATEDRPTAKQTPLTLYAWASTCAHPNCAARFIQWCRIDQRPSVRTCEEHRGKLKRKMPEKRLTVDDANAIRNRAAAGEPLWKLGQEFARSVHAISKIATGQSLTGEPRRRPPIPADKLAIVEEVLGRGLSLRYACQQADVFIPQTRRALLAKGYTRAVNGRMRAPGQPKYRAPRQGRPEIPDDVVLEIRRRVAAGETSAAVAQDIGRHPGTVRRIASGRSRPNVVDPADDLL